MSYNKVTSASWTPGAYPPLDVDARGRGGSQQSFIWGGSAPGFQTLILLYPIFSRKRYPFLVPSIDNWYSFHKPRLELCILLTAVNVLSLKYSINHKTRTFSRLFDSHKKHLWALLGVFIYQNDRFPQPFHILQSVKLPPFNIPKAWKRYPFRVEPPCIDYYREYPRDVWQHSVFKITPRKGGRNVRLL